MVETLNTKILLEKKADKINIEKPDLEFKHPDSIKNKKRPYKSLLELTDEKYKQKIQKTFDEKLLLKLEEISKEMNRSKEDLDILHLNFIKKDIHLTEYLSEYELHISIQNNIHNLLQAIPLTSPLRSNLIKYLSEDISMKDSVKYLDIAPASYYRSKKIETKDDYFVTQIKYPLKVTKNMIPDKDQEFIINFWMKMTQPSSTATFSIVKKNEKKGIVGVKENIR